MVKVTCKVKYGQFRWKRKGYAAVMNDSECQSMLYKEANNIAKSLGPSGAYQVSGRKGVLARGCVIRATPDAMADELRDNKLLRAASGGGK